MTPEGDALWLCAQHARPYLPARQLTAPGGAPPLPAPRPGDATQPTAP
ncbi:hypothetical protein [Streptomyces sp. NPDC001530]